MTFINWDKPFKLDLGNEFLHIPTYGNYGGANYSAGDFGKDPPLDQNGSYLSNKEVHNNKDVLDYLFYRHDVASDLADSPAEDRAKDLELIRRIGGLNDNQLDDPEVSFYAGAATIAFSARLLVNDPERALAKKLVPYMEDALDDIEAGLFGLSPTEFGKAISLLEKNGEVLEEVNFPGRAVDRIMDEFDDLFSV